MKSLDEIIAENKKANEIITDTQIPYCIYDNKKNKYFIGVV